MASPGGGSSGELEVMDPRKRKRMESNRESARRSRMKKQQHLDDLVRQVDELKKENDEMMNKLGITNQLYMNMESQNAVLRTQMSELTHRLDSLNEIITFINNNNNNSTSNNNNNYSSLFVDDHDHENNYYYNDTEIISSDCADGFFNPWVNQPAIMASGNNIMY